MWLEFASPSTVVCLDDFGTIESDALEGVDSNEDDPGVRVDAVLGVTIADCVKDWRIEIVATRRQRRARESSPEGSFK